MVRLFFPIIALVLLAGCDNRGGQQEHNQDFQQTNRGIPSASADTLDGLSVAIHPSSATVLDTLKAVVQGETGRTLFQWEINGVPLAGRNVDRLSPGTAFKGDEVTVRVRCSKSEKTAVATTVIQNTPPRITSVTFVDPDIRRGADIELIPKAEDPDGDQVFFDYTWLVNDEQVAFGPILRSDRFRGGDRILVQIIPFDGENYGPVFPAAEFVIPEWPPFFTTKPAQSFQENGYFYQARAKDPAGDHLIFYLKEGPSGMSVDSESGLLSWDIGDMTDGEHLIRLGVHNSEGLSALQEFTLTITFP